MKKTKRIDPSHEEFKLGQGYASGEKTSDYQAHPELEQYGDNPVPPSGGGYGNAGEVQPDEEVDSPIPDHVKNKLKK